MTQKIHPEIDDEMYVWAQTIASSLGLSMSAYINSLIKKDLSTLTPDEREFLVNWRKKRLNGDAGDLDESDERPPIRKRKG